MQLNHDINFAGEVYAQVRNYKSGTVKRTYGKAPNAQALKARFTRRSESLIERPIRNLITDTGLDFFGTTSWTNVYIFLGTGAEPFIESDTQLKNPYIPNGSASVSESNSQVNISPTLSRHRTTKTATYSAGEVIGNFTEMGVHDRGTLNPSDPNSYLNSPMLALAQIKDNNGDPTSIQVLPDEELIISHSIDSYVEAKSNPGQTLNWNGDIIPCTVSVRRHNNWPWRPSEGYILYTGHALRFDYSRDFSSNLIRNSYVPGSRELQCSLSWPLASNNVEFYGIAICKSSSGTSGDVGYEIIFDDGLPRTKLADEILTIGSAANPAFRYGWGRAII